MQYYPDPNGVTAGVAPWQQNLHWAEHFNKDLFWNWVGKVDHNFGANDRAFFRWGENERNEIGNRGTRDPQRPGPGRPASALARQPRARRRLGAHLRCRDGLQPARQLHLLPGVELFPDSRRFRCDGVLAREPRRQLPSQRIGGLFPRIEVDQFESLSRGTSPNRNRNYTVQPNVSLTRGAHNIRSGLDMRWTNVYNENYNNSGGLVRFNRELHAQHPQQHERARGQRVRLVPARRAEPRRGAMSTPTPHYQWFFVAPWIQDDWRVSDKLTREPRLPLGLQRCGDGRGQPAELHLRSDDRQPGLGARRSAGDGRPHVSPASTAPRNGRGSYDKNNYQFRVGTAYQINEKTVLRGGYGKYFLNPTSQGVHQRLQHLRRRSSRRPTVTARRPTRWRTPGPTGSRTPPGSSLGAQTFLGRDPSFFEPELRRAERAPVLGRHPARAAVAHLARGDLRGQPQLRHRGKLAAATTNRRPSSSGSAT